MAKFLHHNEFGYCVRCPHTGYLHLCFGTVAMALTPPEFKEFREVVAATAYQATQQPVVDAGARCVALRTRADRLALVFTRLEMGQLQELVEMTALLLETEALLGGPAPGGANCAGCPMSGAD
ncbi:DUF6686 family protein [Hymenobacter nivis]|uniref:Uncharacterized protein n=1 Tax=Hymenobacter nivis TaxID=1850093 RepID=A0A502H1Q6_9BACT|nr:DUF6686 family protein [Hymenobacter nivis]TPG67233.1 hypothetical protein EAH73_05750 [Hymenobacter nivis]